MALGTALVDLKIGRLSPRETPGKRTAWSQTIAKERILIKEDMERPFVFCCSNSVFCDDVFIFYLLDRILINLFLRTVFHTSGCKFWTFGLNT